MAGMHTTVVLVVAVFVAGAAFGLFVPIGGHAEHDAGCMVAFGEVVVCAASLAYFSDWRAIFASALVVVSMLLPGVAIFCRAVPVAPLIVPWRYRQNEARPVRPTDMQELFSDGILHRKEPHLFLGCITR